MSAKQIIPFVILTLVAACASAPQSAQNDARAIGQSAEALTGISLSNLSRIQIVENTTITQSMLPEMAGAALPISEAQSESQSAHEEAATIRQDNAPRINNLSQGNAAQVIFKRAQNTALDGWAAIATTMVHLESGLACPLSIDVASENRQYLLDEIIQFDAAGRDVACNFQAPGVSMKFTIFATYWPDVTQDQHLVSAVAAIYQGYTVTQEMPVSVVSLEPEDGDEAAAQLFEDLEEPSAGGFLISDADGVAAKTAIWLVKTNDWHVKVRATYATDDVMTEVVSAIYFAMSHLSVKAKNLEEPVAPGVDV